MKQFLLTILLITSIEGMAQNVKIAIEEQSLQIKNISGTWNLKERFSFEDGNNFIQVNNNGVNKFQLAYTVRYNKLKHALSITKVDEEGNELAINKLDNGERAFGPIPSASIEFDGKILLFYFRYMDKDSMKLFMSEIDRSSLQLKNTQILYSYSQRNSGLGGIIKESGREITLRLSPDHNKLLVVIPGFKEDVFACVLEKGLVMSSKKALTISGTEDFILNHAYVDNNGTGLIVFSDQLTSDKSFNNSTVKKILILSQSNIKQTDMSTIAGGTELNNVEFRASKDQSKIYLFGDYRGEIANAGIWISEMSNATLKISKPRLIPYTEELIKTVYKIGFGERKRSAYGIRGTVYDLTEFENGDLTISGSPMARDDRTYVDWEKHKTKGHIYYYSGPLIMAILQSKKEAIFTMIPKHQIYCDGSYSTVVPYKDKLIVLYNDYYKNFKEKFLPDDVWQKAGTNITNYCLGYAVVKKDGTIESRSMLAEGPTRMTYFNTSSPNYITNYKISFPIAGYERKPESFKVAVVTIE